MNPLTLAEELMRVPPKPATPSKRVLQLPPDTYRKPSKRGPHPMLEDGIRLLRAGWKVRDICAKLKVTPKTVCKWRQGDWK